MAVLPCTTGGGGGPGDLPTLALATTAMTCADGPSPALLGADGTSNWSAEAVTATGLAALNGGGYLPWVSTGLDPCVPDEPIGCPKDLPWVTVSPMGVTWTWNGTAWTQAPAGGLEYAIPLAAPPTIWTDALLAALPSGGVLYETTVSYTNTDCVPRVVRVELRPHVQNWAAETPTTQFLRMVDGPSSVGAWDATGIPIVRMRYDNPIGRVNATSPLWNDIGTVTVLPGDTVVRHRQITRSASTYTPGTGNNIQFGNLFPKVLSWRAA